MRPYTFALWTRLWLTTRKTLTLESRRQKVCSNSELSWESRPGQSWLTWGQCCNRTTSRRSPRTETGCCPAALLAIRPRGPSCGSGGAGTVRWEEGIKTLQVRLERTKGWSWKKRGKQEKLPNQMDETKMLFSWPKASFSCFSSVFIKGLKKVGGEEWKRQNTFHRSH